jgi:hypothetical protein
MIPEALKASDGKNGMQVPQLFEEVALLTEDPIEDPVTLPTLLLARRVAQFTKVALSGDGSDEFWGGYARFDNPPASLDEYLPRSMVFGPEELGLKAPPASYLDDVILPAANLPPLDRILRLEAANRLRNYHLARVDKLGMAAALEIRSPFIDARVTRLAQSIRAEIKDRRYDVSTLAEAARRCRMTLVLKNHTYPTTPLAALARSRFDVRFLGSVVLNRFVGGLNPDAVYGAASGNRAKLEDESNDPTFVVYMPTVHAESHLRVLDRAFDRRWSRGHNMKAHANDSGGAVRVFDEQLRPEPVLRLVLESIVKTGATLATGHLASAEIMALVPMALEIGVSRVLLTHPHYPSVELSNDQLIQLTRDSRVFIEHSTYPYKTLLENSSGTAT